MITRGGKRGGLNAVARPVGGRRHHEAGELHRFIMLLFVSGFHTAILYYTLPAMSAHPQQEATGWLLLAWLVVWYFRALVPACAVAAWSWCGRVLFCYVVMVVEFLCSV